MRPSSLILIVDDYADALEIYQESMTMMGYRVLTAPGGAEAIDLAHEHLPDLILMDLSMPGMNGAEAMQAIRADPTCDQIRIVAFTAHAMVTERAAALADGFDEVIAKPCMPEELAVAVDRILATARDMSAS